MPRRNALTGLTVAQVFNEAQRVTTPTGLLRYARVLWDLFSEDEEGTLDQLLGCVAWILKAEEKSVYVSRVIEFAGVVASQASGGTQVVAVEELVKQLAEWTEAADHVARWRACQLLLAVLEKLPEEGISDELMDQCQEVLLARLDDTKAAVRVATARALHRLAQPGDDGDYFGCKVTEKLLEVLNTDKNKDVRKAVLSSLQLLLADTEEPTASQYTMPDVLARTVDEADEVRKVVYLVLKGSPRGPVTVPIQALALEDRLLVLQRGLSDRVPAVADAAVSLLHKWLVDCCDGDVCVLLSQLDVVQHSDVAELAVKALFISGALDALEICREAAEGGIGLRQDFSEEGQLFSPEQALYWRALCQELHSAATSKGLAAVAAEGTLAEIEAATADEQYQALEKALPASAEDMAEVIVAHAQGGEQHRFATCQLMLLAGTCMDFTDAASRKAAASLLHSLLTELPSGDDVPGVAQPDSAWRQALGQFLSKVHAEPADLAEAGLMAVGQLAAASQGMEGDSTAAQLQTLGVAGLLLELLPEARPALRAQSEFRLQDLLDVVVMPAVDSEDVLVKREGVRCLGLYSLLHGIPTVLESHVARLRSTLMRWHPTAGVPAEVARVAVQALGDLALEHGIKRLSGSTNTEEAAAEEAEGASTPAQDPQLHDHLLNVMLGVLDRWRDSLEAPEKKSKRAKAEPSGDEAKLVLGAALVEALARLVLHNNRWCNSGGACGLEGAELREVLARLLLLNFDPATERATQLRQCLAMFFSTYAALPRPKPQQAPLQTPPCSRTQLANVFLLAARRANDLDLERKHNGERITIAGCIGAKVVRFLQQLLETPPSKGASGQDEQVAGYDELAIKLLKEVVDLAGMGAAVPKPYLAALCKVLLKLPVAATTPEAEKSIKAAHALAHEAVTLLDDRLQRKDMEAVAERFAVLDTSPAEQLEQEEIEAIVVAARQQDQDYELPEGAEAPPATVARGKTPGRPWGRRATAADSPESGSEEEDSDEEGAPPARRRAAAAAPPTTASRRMPTRSARATRNLAEGSDDSGQDSSSDSGSSSEGEEEAESENTRAAARGRGRGSKAARPSSSDISAVRRALQENRIA